MATSLPPPDNVPYWYREQHLYIVTGGRVQSSMDGDTHLISPLDCARAWGLSARLSNVVLERHGEVARRFRQAEEGNWEAAFLLEPWTEYHIPLGVSAWATLHAHENQNAEQIANERRRRSDIRVAEDLQQHAALSATVEQREPGAWEQFLRLRRYQEERVQREAVERSLVAIPDVVEAWVKPMDPPKPGSRAWKRVVRKGCVGEYDESGDFDCPEYVWGCDSCPVTVDRMEAEAAQRTLFAGRLQRFWMNRNGSVGKTAVEFDFKPRRFRVSVDLASPGGDTSVVVVHRRKKRD